MDNSLDFFNGLLIKGGLCEEGWLKNRKKRKTKPITKVKNKVNNKENNAE